MAEFLSKDISVILFIFQSVCNKWDLFSKDLFFMFSQLSFTLSNSVQNTVKWKHSFSLISLDFKTSINITLNMDEIFIQISEIITGAVKDSFDLSFIFLDSNHFETIFKNSVFLNIIKDIFAKSLEFSNNLVINFLTFLNVLFSWNISKFIFNHNVSSLLFSCIKNFSDFLSLFQLVEEIFKIWWFKIDFIVGSFEMVEIWVLLSWQWLNSMGLFVWFL